jgi:hypothetical protein
LDKYWTSSLSHRLTLDFIGAPNGNRTRVFAVKEG